MLIKILAIVLTLATIIQSTTIKRKFKVYNSEHIQTWNDNPYRYVVMLRGRACCTGSIFNSLTVISAGHCFMNPKYIPTYIALEHAGPQLNMAKTIAIDAVFIPVVYQKLYRKRVVGGEDISVVRLKKSIDIHQFAHTRLVLSKSTLKIGSDIILVGYGKDSSRQEGSGKLRQGNAVVAKCPFDVGDERICAEKAEKFSDQHFEVGDSGAPLITKRNGEHITSGFLSGDLSSYDGQYFMVFASYKRHEEFIDSRAGGN